jgi:hypothetical protein
VKAAKKALADFSPDQTAGAPLDRTDHALEVHAAYVRTLGDEARADWDSDRWTARLAGFVGTDDAIDGVISWKRVAKEQGAFDTTRFRDEHPELHDTYLTPESFGVSVDINFHRPYPIS